MPNRDTLTLSSPWVELSASADLWVMVGRALGGGRWCQWSGGVGIVPPLITHSAPPLWTCAPSAEYKPKAPRKTT
ncbi:hypothetical protein [Actinacidiphila soli]|uniref:hypothetical protein n=1 Tax=Actinacidiphila soli TaxID=2487275 RepID=UPI000FCC4D62|nr:hypothetical protein [Actinacidiphila soli]